MWKHVLALAFVPLMAWEPATGPVCNPHPTVPCARYYQIRAEYMATEYDAQNQLRATGTVNMRLAAERGLERAKGYSPERGYQDEQWLGRRVR